MTLTDPEVLKPCAACETPLPFGKARLMWNPGTGTFRLCKREDGCKIRARQRLARLRRENGDAATIEALQRFVR